MEVQCHDFDYLGIMLFLLLKISKMNQPVNVLKNPNHSYPNPKFLHLKTDFLQLISNNILKKLQKL